MWLAPCPEPGIPRTRSRCVPACRLLLPSIADFPAGASIFGQSPSVAKTAEPLWMTTVSIPSISIHVRTVRPLWITAVSTLGNVVRLSGVVCLDESVQEGTAWWTDIGHWTWEIPSASHHNYNQYHCHYDGTVKLLLIPSHRSCHSLTAVVPPNNPLEYCSVQFDHGTRSSCRPIHVLQTRVPCQAYMLSTPLPKSTHGAASNIGVASTPGSVTHTPHVLLLTPCSWWPAK